MFVLIRLAPGFRASIGQGRVSCSCCYPRDQTPSPANDIGQFEAPPIRVGYSEYLFEDGKRKQATGRVTPIPVYGTGVIRTVV